MIRRVWQYLTRGRAKRLRVLRLLAANGEMYGLDLVKQGRLTRGLIYVLLDRMEEEGLIVSRPSPGLSAGYGVRRRYHITEQGKALL